MIIDTHAHCGRWFFPTFCESPEKVGSLLDRYDIEKAIFSSSKAITYNMESGNREAEDFVRSDKRFYAYAYLNPRRLEACKDQIERYLGLEKFVGIKLHPSYSREAANSPNTLALLNLLPADKVVLVHTWGPSGVSQVSELARSSPTRAVIMGHMGGTEEAGWKASIEAAAQIPNVYLEICGSLLQYDRIGEAVRRLGSKRILFGSDMTLISPAFALGQVLDARIKEREKEQILRENALRLFPF